MHSNKRVIAIIALIVAFGATFFFFKKSKQPLSIVSSSGSSGTPFSYHLEYSEHDGEGFSANQRVKFVGKVTGQIVSKDNLQKIELQLIPKVESIGEFTAVEGKWVVDSSLRTQSLQLPRMTSATTRRILENVFLSLAVNPSLFGQLSSIKEEKGSYGQYTVDYRPITSAHETRISFQKIKSKTSSLANISGTYKLEGQITWTFAKGNSQLLEVIGTEKQVANSNQKSGESTVSEFKLKPTQSTRAPDEKDFAPAQSNLATYDSFQDPRLQWIDRKLVWEQRIKEGDIEKLKAKLSAEKIDPNAKVEITLGLEAYYSLNPDKINELEDLIWGSDPESDGFHLASIILAKLRVEEVNATFISIASKLADKPEALANFALYFNDLSFPNSEIFQFAFEQSKDLEKKSGLRFALATGSLLANSDNQELKTRYVSEIEKRFSNSSDEMSKKFWVAALGNAGQQSSLPTILNQIDANDEISLTAINALRKYSWSSIGSVLLPLLESGREAQILQIIKILVDVKTTEEERSEIKAKLSNHPLETVRKRFEALDKLWSEG